MSKKNEEKYETPPWLAEVGEENFPGEVEGADKENRNMTMTSRSKPSIFSSSFSLSGPVLHDHKHFGGLSNRMRPSLLPVPPIKDLETKVIKELGEGGFATVYLVKKGD